MTKNKTLSNAKSAKNDEFYTQYADIQKEINAYLDYDPDVFRGKTVLLPCDDPEWSNFTRFFAQNFETLGLKKLISTSYAPEAKKEKYGILFEYAVEQNGGRPKNERGKIFVLDHDTNASGRIDLDDLEWDYLDGDGDFRSEEVCKLRDEADVIVTNPPFSLFREFLAWILAAKNAKDTKKFLIIGNMNAIKYKETFPLIKVNKMWLGASVLILNKIILDVAAGPWYDAGMIPRLKLDVPADDRAELERRSRSRSERAGVAFRAKIILLRAEGLSKLEVAEKLGTSEPTVQKWTGRYQRLGLAGLDDAKGRGRKPSIDPLVRERIVTGATQPPEGLARHSTRTMARAAGVSQSTVLRTWQSAGIKPHLVRTFKVSNDPDFRAKFWDVIGLYLDPPDKAVVFCCDEKTQCQALERTQLGLPLGIGHVRTRTHDYTRNGTTNLFAALNCATGELIHRHYRRHTHREWLSFLKKVWHETPNDVSLEIIADNYATHKHPKVREWLAKHPRVHIHYTPTSSSWLNLVERFFGEITSDCIREGSFSSVAELEKANDEFIATRNANPKPFVWHSKGEDILAKLNRARRVLGVPELDTEMPPPRERKQRKGKRIYESAH